MTVQKRIRVQCIIIIIIIIIIIGYHLYVGYLQLHTLNKPCFRGTFLQLLCIYNLCYM